MCLPYKLSLVASIFFDYIISDVTLPCSAADFVWGKNFVFLAKYFPQKAEACAQTRKSAPYITTGDISTVDSVFCIMGSQWQGNNVTSQHRDLRAIAFLKSGVCTLHIHLMWRWTLRLHSEEVLSFYRHLVARYTAARWTLDFWSQLLGSNEIVLLMLIRYISIILIIKNKAVIYFEMSKIGINLPQRHCLTLCHSLSHSAITPFLNELRCIKTASMPDSTYTSMCTVPIPASLATWELIELTGRRLYQMSDVFSGH